MYYSKCKLSLTLSAALFLSSTYAGSSQHNWSGFYAGANIGIIKHTLSVTDNQAASFYATIDQITNPKLSGGLQLGYRRQLNPQRVSAVYGLEFSANFSNASFSSIYGSTSALYQLQAKNELNNLQLLQLVGGIAVERTLFFIAAGLSSTHVSGSLVNMDGVPFFETLTLNKTSIGWALGAGVEYALTTKLSARFKVDVLEANAYTAYDDVGNSYQIASSNVQGVVGVNYKFG